MDDAARIAITPLIKGEATTLTPDMQSQIATWVAKIAMVGDSRNRKKARIPQAQRYWLRDRRYPPPGWGVWIVPYAGEELRELALYQFGGHLALPERPEGYMQFTVMGMGHVLALVIGTDIPNIRLTFEPLEQQTTRIWPTGAAVPWDPDRAFTDAQAEPLTRVHQIMMALPVGD